LYQLLDIAIILPFLLGVFVLSAEKPSTHHFSVLRIVRISIFHRVFQMGHFKALKKVSLVFFTAFQQSSFALFIAYLLWVVYIVLFGTLIYVVECGTFTVDTTFPNGEYVIYDSTFKDVFYTGFTSIPACMYFIIATSKYFIYIRIFFFYQ
jgi:hypothetical protein